MKVKIRITGKGLTSLRAAEKICGRGLARWISRHEITMVDGDPRIGAAPTSTPRWPAIFEIGSHPEIVDAFPGMPVIPTFGYDRTGRGR